MDLDYYFLNSKWKWFSIISGLCSIISLLISIVMFCIEHPTILPYLPRYTFPFIPIIIFLVSIQKGRKGLSFDEQEIIWTLDIDKEGNTFVKRKCTFINNSSHAVSEKEHYLECFDNPMEWDKMGLKAWDYEGHSLHIEKIQDKPNKKRFCIKFYQVVGKKKHYSYGYGLFWQKFLPCKENYFIIESSSYICVFILRLPVDMHLKRLICKEFLNDEENGQECDEIGSREIKQIDGKVEYKLRVVKTKKFNNVKLLWNID